MSILLIGRWTWAGHLEITESHAVEDGDQDAIRKLVDGHDIGELFAAEFLVDDHKDAVQRAYEEYVADDGAELIDEVEGFEPAVV
ncbi:hypothetical protein [Streptomyces lanatus]|uniref:Uncharacterized protein n=1 Tax=Streptomyces lanatus TaxID=66900 RepID=A0ABV1XZY0_9ACTN|nr:hypothetical protein [Streptomyces lanatus]GHH22396.1 hypothetical protein GCM10018780_70830 [Streptomyces lanatus]